MKRPAFHADRQERRHLEMDLALYQDYAAHLAAALDAVEQGRRQRWRQLRQRLLARLRRWRAG